jgi:hypothetical protein
MKDDNAGLNRDGGTGRDPQGRDVEESGTTKTNEGRARQS